MVTPTLDLTIINLHSQIIVRGGDTAVSGALRILRNAYQRDPDYPDVVGISVLFRAGADVEELARTNPLPNARLSHATVGHIMAELALVGCALMLYVTPQPMLGLPDHHTVAVARLADGTRVEPPAPDEPLVALTRAMVVSDNHYRKQRP